MSVVCFAAGGFVIAVVLFKRDLLFRPETFKIIFGVAAALFVAGAALLLTRLDKSETAGALLSPMISLGLFSMMRKLFRFWLKRDPEDTFLNWNAGLGPDRVFNIVYFTIAFSSWALITALAPQVTDALR